MNQQGVINQVFKIIFCLLKWLIRLAVGVPLLIGVIILLFVLYDYIDLFFSKGFRFERYSNSTDFHEALQSKFINSESSGVIEQLEGAGAKCEKVVAVQPEEKKSPAFAHRPKVDYYFGCDYNSRLVGVNGFYEYRTYFYLNKDYKVIHIWAGAHRIYI